MFGIFLFGFDVQHFVICGQKKINKKNPFFFHDLYKTSDNNLISLFYFIKFFDLI